MTNESVADAGERFARDMRRIREYRDVSVDDIHESTRIALTLIEAFEEGRLYEHPGFNRVYLRSFVRAYAGCIDVDPDRAIAALKEVMNGDYENELAATYLAGEPDVETPSDSSPDPTDADDTPGSSGDAGTSSGSEGGDGAADPESHYSRRLGRPMGGTAAANDDLSSVSKPKPMSGSSSTGASADSSASEPADTPPATDAAPEEEAKQETEDAPESASDASTSASEDTADPKDAGTDRRSTPAPADAGALTEDTDPADTDPADTDPADPADHDAEPDDGSESQESDDVPSWMTASSGSEKQGADAAGSSESDADWSPSGRTQTNDISEVRELGETSGAADTGDTNDASGTGDGPAGGMTAEEAIAQREQDGDDAGEEPDDVPSWFGAHEDDELTDADATDPADAGADTPASADAEAPGADADDLEASEWETSELETGDASSEDASLPRDADDQDGDEPSVDASTGSIETSPTPASEPEADAEEETVDEEASVQPSSSAKPSSDTTSPDPDSADTDSDEEDVHPLMRDPEDLDASEMEEEEGEPHPPDLQPHEDPSSGIGPSVEDGEEAPAWLSSENPDTSASPQEGGRDGQQDRGARRSGANEPPSPLTTLFRQRKLEVLAGVAAILVVGGAILAYSFGVFGGDTRSGGEPTSGTSSSAQAGVASGATASGETNTADAAEASSAPQRPPANLTLGDSLRVTVLAGSDVTGIRLQRDDDLRRPYWIEAGEATVFPFADRVIISNQLENVDRLLLEGYPYPLDERDARGRIVIDREAAQAFADTLRGEPASLAVEADTNYIPSYAPAAAPPGREPADADTSGAGE